MTSVFYNDNKNLENVVLLTGETLTLKEINEIMEGKLVDIDLMAIERINKAHNYIKKIMESEKTVYGINTGFGSLCNTKINTEDTKKLQINLIRSHAMGTGKPVNYKIVRCMMLLRINCICKGHSGVSIENTMVLVDALNKNLMPLIPKKGTVGASGDLAPLSHMALGLLGEGLIRHPLKSIYNNFDIYLPAMEVMKEYDCKLLDLGPKEGLALNNGTQFITAYTVYAYYKSKRALKCSTITAAITLESLRGTAKAFHPNIHQTRKHKGQLKIASDMLVLLGYNNNNNIKNNDKKESESEIQNKYGDDRVQDAYSLRCIPQIHGPVYDMLRSVKKILVVEINSATDNPLIFPEDDLVISGGNFHAQYPATAAELISLSMSILSNVSERRLERLLNGNINTYKNDNGQNIKHLPSFLTENPGLNSGLMTCQLQSASLTAENRQLANPATTHNIPTCENQEDVVSMGGYSSRKALKSATNTIQIIANELYAACLACQFTSELPSPVLQSVIKLVNVSKHSEDRYYQPEVERVHQLILSKSIELISKS